MRTFWPEINQKGSFWQDLFHAYYDEIECTLSILEGKRNIYSFYMSDILWNLWKITRSGRRSKQTFCMSGFVLLLLLFRSYLWLPRIVQYIVDCPLRLSGTVHKKNVLAKKMTFPPWSCGHWWKVWHLAIKTRKMHLS